MNKRIAHRGPDGSGIWCNESRNLVLGHNRLSIIDLSDGAAQPMVDHQTLDALVFNGEIYNYKELKGQAQNQKWLTSSDTEVLFHYLQLRNFGALSNLNGMFAFAYWDNSNEKLHLAIDAMGKKPLYYTTLGGYFAFSSEIKAILELPWVTAELDKESFYHFLTFNQSVPPDTMFKGIHKMAPGDTLTVGKGGIEWRGNYRTNQLIDFPLESERDWAEAILAEFEASVKYRMVSDVSVGAFLSGGVDSSAVVAKMSDLSHKSIDTYTIGFKDQPNYDEQKYAEHIAQHFGTNHHVKVVEAHEVQDLISGVAQIFDDPMVDTTGIPIYFLAQSARNNGTKVVLTGDGADEMFMGYRNWQRYLKYESSYKSVKNLPKPIKSVLAGLANMMKPNHAITDMLFRAKDNREFFWGGARSFKESQKRKYLHQNFFDDVSPNLDSYSIIERYKEQFRKVYGKEEGLAKWMGFLGMEFIVPNWFMYRMDKLGMANSIEIRSPIVDHDLKNLALSCPTGLKVKNGEPKYIFKKALEGTLNSEVLYRKKMGFCLPIKEWGHDIMLDFLEKYAAPFCSETNLLDADQVNSQVKQYRSNPEAASINDMFTLYYFINWHKEWLE